MLDLIGHRLPSRLTLQNISRNLAFKFLTFDGRHGNFPHPHDRLVHFEAHGTGVFLWLPAALLLLQFHGVCG